MKTRSEWPNEHNCKSSTFSEDLENCKQDYGNTVATVSGVFGTLWGEIYDNARRLQLSLEKIILSRYD